MNLLKSNPKHDLRSLQRLAPLLMLAFSLVGLGTYAGYRSLLVEQDVVELDRIEVPKSMQIPVLDLMPENVSKDVFQDGISLYYQVRETQQYEMWMRQQNEYVGVGADTQMLETNVNVAWRDRLQRAEVSEHLDVLREFGDIRIEVREENKQVGADITGQLAGLLSHTRGHITMSDRGLIKSNEWEAEMNAQTAQTLHLLDDGFRLVNPHFLREAVHIGEDWTYWLRTTAEDAHPDRLEANGALEVSNRVEGMIYRNDREYAVIVQNITGTMRGTVDGIAGYTMHGNGRGLVLFDVAAGVLYSSQVEFKRTIKLDKKGTIAALDTSPVQTSNIRLYVVQREDDQAVID